jgi:hypothetical protein
MWVYVAAGAVFVAVVLLTAYDQLVVEYGDDASYLLGKTTPIMTWIVTLVTPFALFDFFAWLRRTRGGTSTFWWAIAAVVASFLIGWVTARRWSLEWLVEGDIEISFDRDEYLEFVVGLWSACLAALIAWATLRTPKVDDQLRTHSKASS